MGCRVRLGDIVSINPENSSPNKERLAFINYLDTGSITNGTISSWEHLDAAKDKIPSRARRKVKKNSIVYSMVRPNQRHFGILEKLPENPVVSTGFSVLDVDVQKANPFYIYYYLSQPQLVEQFHSIAEQSVSAYPTLDNSTLKNMLVELPGLGEQEKIASLLRRFDKKISINNQINDYLAA